MQLTLYLYDRLIYQHSSNKTGIITVHRKKQHSKNTKCTAITQKEKNNATTLMGKPSAGVGDKVCLYKTGAQMGIRVKQADRVIN